MWCGVIDINATGGNTWRADSNDCQVSYPHGQSWLKTNKSQWNEQSDVSQIFK